MKNGWKSNGSFRAVVGVLLMVVMFLSGCQTVSMSQVGRRVSPQKRVPLASDGSHSATYRTDDLVIDCRYSRNQSVLELSGSVRFADRIRWSFKRVDGFHADAIFISESGVVMDSQGLITSPSSSIDSPIQFKSTVTVPQDVVAISFSYTGEAANGGGGGVSQMSFWDYPAH